MKDYAMYTQEGNDAVAALNNLIDMDIKAGAAFKLMRIIKQISDLVDDKLKMEQKILDKWIERGVDGQPIKVYDENNKHKGMFFSKDFAEKAWI